MDERVNSWKRRVLRAVDAIWVAAIVVGGIIALGAALRGSDQSVDTANRPDPPVSSARP